MRFEISADIPIYQCDISVFPGVGISSIPTNAPHFDISPISVCILLSLSADISVTAEIFKPFTLLIQYYQTSHKVFNFINMTSSFNNLTYLLNQEYSVYSEKHNEWNQNSYDYTSIQAIKFFSFLFTMQIIYYHL